jgi:cytochrome c oxidase subunit 2
MLFNVKVVSRDEYDAHIEELRDAGQDGQLGLEYNRLQDVRVTGEGPEGEEGES